MPISSEAVDQAVPGTGPEDGEGQEGRQTLEEGSALCQPFGTAWAALRFGVSNCSEAPG